MTIQAKFLITNKGEKLSLPKCHSASENIEGILTKTSRKKETHTQSQYLPSINITGKYF